MNSDGGGLRTAQLKAFSIYLRTGRRASIDGEEIERKFNPWHDLENGRFTFVGRGRYFAGDSLGEGGRPRSKPPRSSPKRTNRPDGSRGWMGGGFTGGGEGDYGGAGTSASWEPTSVAPHPQVKPSREAARRTNPASQQVKRQGLSVGVANKPKFARISKNGYDFDIDERKRTRRASGQLAFSSDQQRSKRSQAEAGGTDRRSTDDGGHYIAARFNGPRDAFNHFAQDASFNRGAYRAIEDGWAKDLKAGRRVFVDIVPHYEGTSGRPNSLAVTWYVNGKRFGREFPNENKRVNRMAKDKFDAIGPMLGAIGEEVAHELGGNPDGIYLYVEVGDNWISVNVFRDDGDVVRNYDHDDDLTELIWDVWAAEDADKRWCVMEYEIRGTRFDVSFKFPDEVDVESMEVDRRDVALKQRYGDKPVVYPPIPEHLLKLQRD